MGDIPEDVISRAKSGDIDAFEYIYKAASGFVYGIALRMTKSREDSEEVTQDVFVKIHKNLRLFESRSSLKTWIYRITVNMAINVSRRSNRLSVSYDDAVLSEPSSSSAEDSIEREDNERRLHALLDVLNADQRACVLLREVEGLNYKEIAEATGSNLNTVRTRLKRAREAILAAFRGKEVGHGL